VRYDDNIQFLIDEFRKSGKKIYYDIDDLIFNLNNARLVADSIGYKLRNSNEWDAWFAYISRHEATMRLCDGCITTNQTLANQIELHTNLPTKVMRNFINKEQEVYSDKIFEAKLSKEYAADGSIKIGYFSGTPTHARDLEVAIDGIISAANANSQISLVLAGHIEINNFAKKLKNRISIIPYQDPIRLQKTISEVDINIAPLALNIFTECKSELKFFEAGIVGTMTIASPSKVFQNCITNGKNGLLSNPEDWNKKISLAANDREFRVTAAKESQQSAKAIYTWKTILNEILIATRSSQTI
jgi:glycosyltransferase involved in cell wall biosynthesis